MLSFFSCSILASTNRTYCASIPGGGTAGKRTVTPPTVRRGPGMGGGGIETLLLLVGAGRVTSILTYDLSTIFWGLRAKRCEGTSWLGISPQLRFCEHGLTILATHFNHLMGLRSRWWSTCANRFRCWMRNGFRGTSLGGVNFSGRGVWCFPIFVILVTWITIAIIAKPCRRTSVLRISPVRTKDAIELSQILILKINKYHCLKFWIMLAHKVDEELGSPKG